MNARDHLDAAEQLLGGQLDTDEPWDDGTASPPLLAALAHATIAVALELGVPHGAAPAAEVPGG